MQFNLFRSIPAFVAVLALSVLTAGCIGGPTKTVSFIEEDAPLRCSGKGESSKFWLLYLPITGYPSYEEAVAKLGPGEGKVKLTTQSWNFGGLFGQHKVIAERCN